MMTPYEKPNGSWATVVQVDGQRKKVTAPTRKECERKAAQVLLDLGGKLQAVSTTVGALLWDWQEAGGVKGELADSFIADIDSLVPKLPEAFTELTLDQVDSETVSALYRELRRRSHAKGCKPYRCGKEPTCPLSVHRVRRLHTILHAAFKMAVTEYHLLQVNPIEAVKAPPAPAKKVTAPSGTDVALVLAETAGTDFGLYLELSAITGARRGEVVALQWQDLHGEELHIIRSLSETTKAGVKAREGKTGAQGHRTVALPAAISRALSEHHIMQRALAAAAGMPEPVWVFSIDAGATPWRPGFVSLKFRRLCVDLGIAKVIATRDQATGKILSKRTETRMTLHGLRHFMATQMLNGGVPLSTVSKRLGHGSETTTARFYSDYLQAADQGAADKMAAILAGVTS